MSLLLAAANPLEHVVSHVVVPKDHSPVGFAITNHMVMALIAALLMILLFPILFSKPKSDAPSGLRNFFESILQFLRTDVFRPALKEHADRFTPFLWTVFFFILFCNLLGFLPLGEIIRLIFGGRPPEGVAEVYGTATGNIATTAALAICAFIFIHLNGIWQVARELIAGTYGHHGEEVHDAHGAHGGQSVEHGQPSLADAHAHAVEPSAGHVHRGAHGMNPAAAAVIAPFYYLWNFAPHLFKPKAGEPATGWLADIPIWGLLVVLELVGALIKPFALCMRLFANMIAGHIVLAVLAGLIVMVPSVLGQIAIGVPITAMSLLIRLLELFVCFLQAYIFTFLTTLFVAAAVAPEH
jgi:F0F1-type ATP synthase membrane subunit a